MRCLFRSDHATVGHGLRSSGAKVVRRAICGRRLRRVVTGLYFGLFATMAISTLGMRSLVRHSCGARYLGYAELAYLRRGPRAAILSVLAALYKRGHVNVWRKGTVMRTGPTLRSADGLEAAVWRTLSGPSSPRLIASKPALRRALADTRRDLVARGSLHPIWVIAAQRLAAASVCTMSAFWVFADHGGLTSPRAWSGVVIGVCLWLLPSRTVSGRRAVSEARRSYPLPTDIPKEASAESVGLLVALHGERALLMLVPRFSRDGGLFDRRTRREPIMDGTLDSPNQDLTGG